MTQNTLLKEIGMAEKAEWVRQSARSMRQSARDHGAQAKQCLHVADLLDNLAETVKEDISPEELQKAALGIIAIAGLWERHLEE
jgi:hypothetical protein